MGQISGDGTFVLPPAVRGGWLFRVWRSQDPHALYLAAAALLLGFTLVIDLVDDRETLNPLVLWALLGVCVAGAAAALLLGRRFPRWLGYVAVTSFAVAQTYFLSDAADAQSAISSLQELPILAFYLGWFVPPAAARIIMAACVILFGTVMVLNPIFAPDGVLGVPAGVHGILGAVFCFEVGSFLWRVTEKRASTDQLTGTLNRRGILKALGAELGAARRSGSPLVVVVVDFDGFKELNDTQGHAAGDAALCDTVAEWRRAVRARDLIGRTGGDEFLLVLRRTRGEGAAALMNRLQRDAAHSWSWGAAEAWPGDDCETLIARADESLYEQKVRR